MTLRRPLDRSKILKPTRAAAAAADAVAVRCETPLALWESLASSGVIPYDWIGARRLFGDWCRVCVGRGLRDQNFCVRCGGLQFWGEGVPAIPLALRLAADVPGVIAVEALAEEFVARLVRHGARLRFDQVRWRLAGAIVEVSSRHWSSLYGNPDEAAYFFGPRVPLVTALADDEREVERFVARRPHVPNPLDPLLAIYERGYGLDVVMFDGPVLIAPLGA